MIYFCADDYGMSKESNIRIKKCEEEGVLNKISILPNGEITDFKKGLLESQSALSLHINLVEGYPISNPKDISLLLSDDGSFKYSFVGLLLLCFSPKRKQVEKQVYTEILNQVEFWQKHIGVKKPLFIDSHQHVHMIPLIFNALMQVVKDKDINVEYLRIPAEPIKPYIFTPSLYLEYSFKGLAKQWLLKFLAFMNRKEIKNAKVHSAYFMGAVFSGELSEKRVNKLLPKYLRIARKNNKDIEVCFHPGYSEQGESLFVGNRKDFEKFYFSTWRKKEYDALLNIKTN